MRTFKIHKPTHRFLAANGDLIAIGQQRGDIVYLNRFDAGALVEKTYAVGSCADALTGYGKGVSADEPARLAAMQGAYKFTFGAEGPLPTFCERA